MNGSIRPGIGPDFRNLRQRLAQTGAALESTGDLTVTLGLVLQGLAARERAQGGALYLRREGRLHFVATSLDGEVLAEINRELIDQKLSPGRNSLVTFVAGAKRATSLTDVDGPTRDSPFAVGRDFDAVTGCRTQSAMAVPLECPDGRLVGVVKLVNCLGPSGQIVPFAGEGSEDLRLLASIAAVAIEKCLSESKMRWAHLEAILRLSAAAELRSGDMTRHVRRVSRLSWLIAKGLGLSYAETDRIRYASPMHDIGKTRLPDAILRKPGTLSDSESRVMRTHTLIGARILSELGGDMLKTARDVAMSHHERWDGSGYPHGRAQDETPLSGRIVALADAFDALVTDRSYRPSCALGAALDIVRSERGKQFDPDVARAFLLAEDRIHEVYRA